jgi:hypothetical protein
MVLRNAGFADTVLQDIKWGRLKYKGACSLNTKNSCSKTQGEGWINPVGYPWLGYLI